MCLKLSSSGCTAFQSGRTVIICVTYLSDTYEHGPWLEVDVSSSPASPVIATCFVYLSLVSSAYPGITEEHINQN